MLFLHRVEYPTLPPPSHQDNAMDRADACEQAAKDAKTR